MPPQVQSVLEMKGHLQLSGAGVGLPSTRTFSLATLKLSSSHSKPCTTLNIALLLPTEYTQIPAHSCIELINLVYSSKTDLLDQPLENPDDEWFTDESSFVQEDIRKADYVVMSFYSH